MRKSQNTSLTERSNVDYLMWRKKIDNSLFRHKGTTIPRWVAQMWELEKYFPDREGKSSKNDPITTTKIKFLKKKYSGNVTCFYPKNRANKVHRLWISEELTDELKKVFMMSHMRDIESALRGDVGDIEKQIPFWEFVDIEFGAKEKEFIFTAHYKQEPVFPTLFANLAGSPALKIIEDEIKNKNEFRIHKQDWKIKNQFDTEIGAFNVIYTLLDTKNKLIYIGEAKDLRKRLKQNYSQIPYWTHYRYDTLPKNTSTEIRVALERMVIRSYASLLSNSSSVETFNISNYKLVNEKIDK